MVFTAAGDEDYFNSTGWAWQAGSGTDWNCNNRLYDAGHRQGILCYYVPPIPCYGRHNEEDYDADFNGLDYMWLFNLYSVEQGSAYSSGATTSPYLQGMMNSYYCDDFSMNYPDGSDIGSFANKLKLNWLEYLAATSSISPGGWLDFRGAQTIDLKPGFYAQSGCFFYAHIKDYNCSGGDPGDGAYNFAELNPSPPDYRTPPRRGDTSSIVDTGWRNIIYLPYELGYNVKPFLIHKDVDTTPPVDYSGVANNIPAFLQSHKNEVMGILDTLQQEVEIEKLNGINNDSLEMEISYIYSMLIGDSIPVSVYPNPTKGICYLEYSLNTPQTISIALTNTLGQDLSFLIGNYDKEVQPGQYNVLLNTDKLAPGLYYVTIKAGNSMTSKKITVFN